MYLGFRRYCILHLRRQKFSSKQEHRLFYQPHLQELFQCLDVVLKFWFYGILNNMQNKGGPLEVCLARHKN